jgi:hypothetical protein
MRGLSLSPNPRGFHWRLERVFHHGVRQLRAHHGVGLRWYDLNSDGIRNNGDCWVPVDILIETSKWDRVVGWRELIHMLQCRKILEIDKTRQRHFKRLSVLPSNIVISSEAWCFWRRNIFLIDNPNRSSWVLLEVNKDLQLSLRWINHWMVVCECLHLSHVKKALKNVVAVAQIESTIKMAALKIWKNRERGKSEALFDHLPGIYCRNIARSRDGSEPMRFTDSNLRYDILIYRVTLRYSAAQQRTKKIFGPKNNRVFDALVRRRSQGFGDFFITKIEIFFRSVFMILFHLLMFFLHRHERGYLHPTHPTTPLFCGCMLFLRLR